jgi:hypothetical protein
VEIPAKKERKKKFKLQKFSRRGFASLTQCRPVQAECLKHSVPGIRGIRSNTAKYYQALLVHHNRTGLIDWPEYNAIQAAREHNSFF